MAGCPAQHHYLIALGSNRRHHGYGAPARVLDAALLALAADGIDIVAAAPATVTRPIGPSSRSYANSAAIIQTALFPDAVLALLKSIEARFGRRRGQRWSSRTLDLDIILWSVDSGQSQRPTSSFRTGYFAAGSSCWPRQEGCADMA